MVFSKDDFIVVSVIDFVVRVAVLVVAVVFDIYNIGSEDVSSRGSECAPDFGDRRWCRGVVNYRLVSMADNLAVLITLKEVGEIAI